MINFEYKFTKSNSTAHFFINENDLTYDNSIENFTSNVKNEFQQSGNLYLQTILDKIENFSDIKNLDFILNLIDDCEPVYFSFLLQFIHIIFTHFPCSMTYQYFNYEMLFSPLIKIAHKSFFDIPNNLYILANLFEQLLNDKNLNFLYIKSAAAEFPFLIISIISSDTAYCLENLDREKFDLFMIAKCIQLIGDFFNFDFTTQNDTSNNFDIHSVFPQIHDSIKYLLSFVKSSKNIISYYAIKGLFKASKIVPLIVRQDFFNNEYNYQQEFLDKLLSNQNSNNIENIINSNEINLIDVQIEIFNFFEIMIGCNKPNEVINENDSNLIHFILNIINSLSTIDKQELYIQSLINFYSHVLNSLQNFSVPNFIKGPLSIQILNILSNESSPYNLKYASFQWLLVIFKKNAYYFINSILVKYIHFVNSIQQLIPTLDHYKIFEFLQVLYTFLTHNTSENINEIFIHHLIQINFIDDLYNIKNNTYESDETLNNLIDLLTTYQNA